MILTMMAANAVTADSVTANAATTAAVAAGAEVMGAAAGAGAASAMTADALATLVKRRRRRRETLHERERTPRFAGGVHRSDEALWPDSVANPGRVRVR